MKKRLAAALLSLAANSAAAESGGLEHHPRSLPDAAARGALETVRVLIELDISVEQESPPGRTALIAASGAGHVEIVELLLASGANVEASSPVGGTAICVAARAGKWKVVEVLERAGAKAACVAGLGLIAAAEQGELERVRAFLKSAPREAIRNALEAVAGKHHDELAEMLLAAGAAQPGRDMGLVAAVESDNPALAKRLMQAGARAGARALELAVYKGFDELIPLLIAAGAKPDEGASAKEQPLVTAITWDKIPNREKVIEALIRGGAAVNRQSDFGVTPLMHAASEGNVEVVRLLLRLGADPHLKNRNNSTAYNSAAARRCIEAMKLLEEAGAGPK